MTALPDVYDYLVAAWRLAAPQAGLTAQQVLDGPAVEYAGTKGVAVGATSVDTTAEFTHPPSDLAGGEAERATLPFLIWAGSGDTTFTALRESVKATYAVLLADLARDRTMGGLVHTAWITGGVLDQVQTGRGALVTLEGRIEFSRF